MSSTRVQVRIKPEYLAQGRDALQLIGEQTDQPTEIIRMVYLAGLSYLLGSDFMMQSPSQDSLAVISKYGCSKRAASTDPNYIAQKLAEHSSGASLQVEPDLSELSSDLQRKAHNLWQLFKGGHTDLWSDLDHQDRTIAWLAAYLLRESGLAKDGDATKVQDTLSEET